MQDSKNNCYRSLFQAFGTFLSSEETLHQGGFTLPSLFFLGESVFHKSALGELEGKV